MPEQVERDDPVAAVRQILRQRVVHAAREQQARQQHDGPPALSVLLVCEPLPGVDEGRHEAVKAQSSPCGLSSPIRRLG